jgi:hypothetical protein
VSLRIAPSSEKLREGVGERLLFDAPAPGLGFSTFVPSGWTWKLRGGSATFVASAVVASRNPRAFVRIGSVPFYFAGIGSAVSASGTRKIYLYRQDLYLAAAETVESVVYTPLGFQDIWLPAGTEISIGAGSIEPNDQFSNVELLVERARL